MNKAQKFVPTNLEDVVASDTQIQAEYDGSHKGLPMEEAVGVWRPALERAVSRAWWVLLEVRGLACSPIEERFLAAVWGSAGWGGEFHAINAEGSCVADRFDDGACLDYWNIRSQHPVGPYRADFLLELVLKPNCYPKFPNGNRVAVAIELDGHDFHEKTKAQAARDKKRDRFFTTQGLPLLRFTGSEVFRDADACAHEAFRFLSDRMQEAFKE